MRNSNPENLHPEFRIRVQNLLNQLGSEQLPFRIFEGFRSPERQRNLYAQGRTKPGSIVTRAKPWSSYHQYGVAADFVLFIEGKWSWDDSSSERRRWWSRLHDIAREHGLESLNWENPHLQMAGLSINELRAGRYPPNGDEAWAENLAAAIEGWSALPRAPLKPSMVPERPPISLDEHTDLTEIPLVQNRFRVIARSGLRLRAGPSTGFEVLTTLRPGQVISMLTKQGDWICADLEGDGLADGYCHGGYLVPTVD